MCGGRVTGPTVPAQRPGRSTTSRVGVTPAGSRIGSLHSGFQSALVGAKLPAGTSATWTGGRAVEGTGLENRHTGNGIVSSNLTPSVAGARAPEKVEIQKVDEDRTGRGPVGATHASPAADEDRTGRGPVGATHASPAVMTRPAPADHGRKMSASTSCTCGKGARVRIARSSGTAPLSG